MPDGPAIPQRLQAAYDSLGDTFVDVAQLPESVDDYDALLALGVARCWAYRVPGGEGHVMFARAPARAAAQCTTCGMSKKPVGRSAPLAMANGLCDHECPGYLEEPYPGHHWPGEQPEPRAED